MISIFIIEHKSFVCDENYEKILMTSYVAEKAWQTLAEACKYCCRYFINQAWMEIFGEEELWNKFEEFYVIKEDYETAYNLVKDRFHNNEDFPYITEVKLELLF